MKRKTIFIFTWCFLIVNAVYSQKVISNLGFELLDAKGGVISWYTSHSEHYEIKLDTSVSYTGKCSLLLEYRTDTDTISDNRFAFGNSFIGSSIIKSKRLINISAYIKSQNFAAGYAGIGVRLESKQGTILFETNSYEQNPISTTDWTRVSVELPLTPDVKVLCLNR